MKRNKWDWILLGICLSVSVGLGVKGLFYSINIIELTGIVMFLNLFISTLVWGANNTEFRQDEMGRHIVAKSAEITFYILLVTLLIFYFVDLFYFNHKDSIVQYIILFLLLLYPTVQYFVARKYR